jgi:hypothetical protein
VLVVDGRQANLSAVDCPIFLLAGIKDHITPPEQVWALADRSRLQPGTYRAIWSMAGTSVCSWAALAAGRWTPIAERVRTYSERGGLTFRGHT